MSADPEKTGLPEVDHRAPEVKADSIIGAFVNGAKWWEFTSTGGTMWASDRDKAFVEAERRYPAASPSMTRQIAPAAEYVHHLADCPAIGGNGDADCRCGAVEFLQIVESQSRQLSAAVAALSEFQGGTTELRNLRERAAWYRAGCDWLEDRDGYLREGLAADAAADLERAIALAASPEGRGARPEWLPTEDADESQLSTADLVEAMWVVRDGLTAHDDDPDILAERQVLEHAAKRLWSLAEGRGAAPQEDQ